MAGLAILPKRLKDELDDVEKILCGVKEKKEAENPESPLNKHLPFIHELEEKYGNFSSDTANDIVRKEVGLKFLEVLKTCAVFKDTPEGKKGWEHFLTAADFQN